MEKIHHQHIKKAEKMGVKLEHNSEHGLTEAFWPTYNLRIYGHDARYALEQMQFAQRIIKEHDGESIHMEHDPAEPAKVKIALNGRWLTESKTPALWANVELMDYLPSNEEYPGETTDPHETSGPNTSFKEDEPRTIDGVPTNGREAHQKGFMMPDNPFGGEDPDKRAAWDEEWEASAAEALNGNPKEEETDEESTEEVKPEKGTSVVKTKYRAIYSERGHPTHCGDELAIKLNNLLLNGSHTDIEYFRLILNANEVDMSKYRTSGNGWQGRWRMTGRNKLAKKVHSEGGVLKLPTGETMRMSAEWMATQRFK